MRPKKERIVSVPPKFYMFKPAGIPGIELEKVNLTVDEYEAIRLADYEGLDHEEAAKYMKISRPTFTRLVDKARKKIADALINGKELIIEGGNIHFRKNLFRCLSCGYTIISSFEESNPHKCPSCGSINIKNMAGHFGHGKCCRKRFGR